MNRATLRPTFSTLRSNLDPVAVLVSEAESSPTHFDPLSGEVVSFLVRQARSEVVETLNDLLGLGFSDESICEAVNARMASILGETGRKIGQATTADWLVAVRAVARRVERAGVRRYGLRWRDRVRPGDLRLQ